MDKWEPIETAPKDGTKIVAAGGTYHYSTRPEQKFRAGNYTQLVWWNGDNWASRISDRIDNPKWWIMPLPDPPTK